MGDLERENVRTITKKFKIYIKSKKFTCNKIHLEDNKNSKESSKAIRMHSFVKSRKLIKSYSPFDFAASRSNIDKDFKSMNKNSGTHH